MSTPHHQACSSFLAPRPGRDTSVFGGMFAPFSPPLWIAWLGTLIGVIIAQRALRALNAFTCPSHTPSVESDASRDALQLLGILLLTSFPSGRPPPTPIRLLQGAWTVLALLLASAYGSRLATYLTLERDAPPYETVRDMVLAGLSWGSHIDLSFPDFLDLEKKEWHVAFISRFLRETSEEQRLTRLATKKYALIGIRLDQNFVLEGYAISDTVASTLRPISECTSTFYLSMALRQHSALLPHVDEVTLRLMQGDVMHRLKRELLMNTKLLSGSSVLNDGPTRLEPYDVRGAFLLLAVGYVIAILAAMTEAVTTMAAAKLFKTHCLRLWGRCTW